MEKSDLVKLRNELIKLREDCLSALSLNFDPNGAVILSHAIRWLWFKVNDKPYERIPD